MKIISHSILETENFARDFLKSIGGNTSSGACVVGLYGNLGSGKTAFTQMVAKLLGVEETVTSPTYVIEKIYTLEGEKARFANSFPTVFKHLIHIDAYRLEKSSELAHLGWADIIKDPSNLILIEWPERVADIMPVDHIRLKFTFIDESSREIEVLAPSATMSA